MTIFNLIAVLPMSKEALQALDDYAAQMKQNP